MLLIFFSVQWVIVICNVGTCIFKICFTAGLINDSITAIFELCRSSQVEIERKKSDLSKMKVCIKYIEHIILFSKVLSLHLCQLYLRLNFWIICVITLLFFVFQIVISKNLMLIIWIFFSTIMHNYFNLIRNVHAFYLYYF